MVKTRIIHAKNQYKIYSNHPLAYLIAASGRQLRKCLPVTNQPRHFCLLPVYGSLLNCGFWIHKRNSLLNRLQKRLKNELEKMLLKHKKKNYDN